jgi:hypothetical protein
MAEKISSAREWLDIASRHFGNGTSETTDALVWSIAVSLADIADALKARASSEALPPSKMSAPDELPTTIVDGDGDTWTLVPGTNRYQTSSYDPLYSRERIKAIYGIRLEEGPALTGVEGGES